jgi:hypothetical protein
MNKYVLRTFLVWLALIGVAAGAWFYRSQRTKSSNSVQGPTSSSVEPAAVGPTAGANEPASSTAPAGKTDAPMTPVQLSPERLQSIGVTTGTVEYEPVSDEVRAAGTVDIDE